MSGRRGVPHLAATAVILVATACSPRGASLEIVPARPACTVPKVVLVRWSIPDEEALPALLRVNGPGRPMKDWRRAATRDGEAETGPWASDGLTVTLVSSTGEALARRTLTTAPCGAG